jgi:hypothetical protein
MELGRAMAQTDIETLLQLPIRNIFFHTPAAARKATLAQMQEHYATGAPSYEPLLALVAECLSREPDGTFAAFGPRALSVRDAVAAGHLTRADADGMALGDDDPSGLDAAGAPLERSDVVHDLLAFLAEEMMALHEQKQALVRKALDDVAAETGLPVEEWKLKTKVQKFWQEPESEWVRALRDRGNVKRFSASGPPVERAVVERLTAAGEALAPVLGRIEATDALIDQVVYRLYGLSAEEVAVVEGEN